MSENMAKVEWVVDQRLESTELESAAEIAQHQGFLVFRAQMTGEQFSEFMKSREDK